MSNQPDWHSLRDVNEPGEPHTKLKEGDEALPDDSERDPHDGDGAPSVGPFIGDGAATLTEPGVLAGDGAGDSGVLRTTGDGAVQTSRPAIDAPLLKDLAELDNLAAPGKSPLPTSPDLDLESLSFDSLHDRVTIMLLFEQVVTSEQVQRVWTSWTDEANGGQKEPLWRSFTREPGIDRERVFEVAATVYAFPEHTLDVDRALEFLRETRPHFSERQWEQMRSLSILPVARGLNSTSGMEQLVFVTHDPASVAIRQFVGSLQLRSHEVRFLPEKKMEALIRRGFSKRSEYLERLSAGKVIHDNDSHVEDGSVDEDVLEAEINRSALLALFDAMLIEGVREGASDIHVIPGSGERVEVHFRIDGSLQCWHVDDQVPSTAFMAVVKDQAHGIDRFERDSAQDGSMQRRIDGTMIRFRLSVLPVAHSSGHTRLESVVIRVLDDRKVTADLTELGLSEQSLQRFEKALRQPHGMVVLTGPTGSGKSTTLRAALHSVVSPQRNIITVEDPVEYMVPGVRQVRISHKLPVADAIRYILRHDPDIVMVGEMRDRTTAELAVKLSATGHLTFSTLHTNDAAGAIGRLYKMGIEPYLLAYSINLVAAQRLVRILCPACKRPHTNPTPELLSYVGLSADESDNLDLFKEGDDPECSTCGGAGFKGRRAIAEVLELSDEIRSMIISAGTQIDESAVRSQARKEGMLSLRESARRLVRSGKTSIAEVIRVTGE